MISECGNCGGVGYFIYQDVIGYVSMSMGIDSGDEDLIGEAIYGDVETTCDVCEGTGEE